MELSASEVAVILGVSPRTVRGRMARGELPALKRNGRWVVHRRHLPLTEPQRRRLQEKADSLRETLESALPSRLAATREKSKRSVADLDAFRLTMELLREIRSAEPGALQEETARRVDRLLEAGLLALAEAVQHYDRSRKLTAVERARTAFSRCLAVLLVEGGLPVPEPLFAWVTTLEIEVLPAVAGFARWVEGLDRKGRR